MKYLDRSFTMPVNTKPISDLEYALRVGNITQAEFEQLTRPQPTEAFSSGKSENSSPTA